MSGRHRLLVLFSTKRISVSARDRLLFFCNKKIQSKSFIPPLWRIRFALGHEKSVQSYPNRSHRHSESSNVFEKCHMGPWALGSCTSKLFFQTFFLKPNGKFPRNFLFGGGPADPPRNREFQHNFPFGGGPVDPPPNGEFLGNFSFGGGSNFPSTESWLDFQI